MLNSILMQYHLANRYFDIFCGCEALNTKKGHIEKVLHYTEILFDTMSPTCGMNKELLLFCAEHHDDGRVDQYNLLGKFLDTEVSHSSLGVDRFDKWLQKSTFVAPIDESIQIFRDVMLYHGRPTLCFTEASKPYVNLITSADDLENAAACVSYLIREVETDAKGYKQDYPDMDQHNVSDFVFEHFASGEKFDKIKHCHTYAEYVLFAATLMTSCIKKYNLVKELLQQPGYGYSSILEGYKHVFKCTLSSQMADKAFLVLAEYAK